MLFNFAEGIEGGNGIIYKAKENFYGWCERDFWMLLNGRQDMGVEP